MSTANSDVWKFSTFLLVGLMVGYGFSQFAGAGAEVTVVNPNLSGAQEIAPVSPSFLEVSEDDDDFIGDKNAPITMIEFSDFQCPYCERFFVDTMPSIVENYVNTGKVKLIYRDYPLDFHAGALPAAEAAECAGEQDAFFVMHDRIFQAQSVWSALTDPLPSFKQYAADLGLNTARFDTRLDEHQMQDEVNADVQDGIAAGVFGTPTFFLNGQKIVGAQPYAVFSGLFDSILGSLAQ